MNSEILKHIDAALVEFSGKEFFDDLVRAKQEFARLTGVIDEEDEEYESRMDTFNIWYIFDYSHRAAPTVMERYIALHQLNDEVASVLRSARSSVFQFCGENLRRRLSLKDLLQKNRFPLEKGHERPGLLKGDVFIGKVFSHGEDYFLLPVYCLLPENSISAINRQIKLLLKKNAAAGLSAEQLSQFLMKTVHLRNRYRRFTHVDPKKFFIYE